MSDQPKTLHLHNGLRLERLEGNGLRVVHAHPSDTGEQVRAAWEFDPAHAEEIVTWLLASGAKSIPPIPPTPAGKCAVCGKERPLFRLHPATCTACIGTHAEAVLTYGKDAADAMRGIPSP